MKQAYEVGLLSSIMKYILKDNKLKKKKDKKKKNREQNILNYFVENKYSHGIYGGYNLTFRHTIQLNG